MVVAGRRTRIERGRRRRWPRLLFTALGLGLAVMAVGSIVRGGAEGPDPALDFADRVRPATDLSTRQAATLDELRSQVGTQERAGLRRGAERLVEQSRAALDEVAGVRPPDQMRAAHGLLMAALTARSEALAAFAAALAGDLAGRQPDGPVDALVDVGRDLAVSDRAYRLFLDQLPEEARATMPASTWVTDETRWGRPEMAALVAILRARESRSAVHDVSVLTVTVDPAPVGSDGANQVLPVSRTLRLQVVVANTGSVAQRQVTVQAVVSSEGGIDTARQFVDLEPGQRSTVGLTLRPSPVGTLTLKVTAGPVAEETNVSDNERVNVYVMR